MNKILEKINNLPKSMKSSIAFMSASILEKGIGFITIPLFTRLLSEDIFGQVSVYNSWRDILNMIITFSLAGGVINNAMLDFEEDKEGFISSILSLILLSSLFFYGFYLVFSDEISEILNYDKKLIRFMFLGFAFNSSFGIWAIKERFYYNYKKVIPISFCIALLSPLSSYIFIKYINISNLYGKIYGDGLISLIINIIIFILILISGKKIISLKYWKYAFIFNLPLIPHYLSHIILAQSDRIMIAKYIGNDKAGIYSLAYTVGSVINIFIAAINTSFIPWTYKKMQEKKYLIIGENAFKLSCLSALISIFFILLAPELIRIMAPPSYYEAIYIIPPVVIGTFYTFIYTFFGNIEFYHKKTIYVMIASILSATINFLLNMLYIPKYGYVAAGYTTMISYFFMIIIHYKFMKKIEKNKIYDMKKIIFIIILTTILGLLVLITYNYFYIRILIVLSLALFIVIKREIIIRIIKKEG